MRDDRGIMGIVDFRRAIQDWTWSEMMLRNFSANISIGEDGMAKMI